MYAIADNLTIEPTNIPHHRPVTSNPKVYPNKYSKGGVITHNAIKTMVVIYFKRPRPRMAPVITDFNPSSW
jgi:hypothetical protein